MMRFSNTHKSITNQFSIFLFLISLACMACSPPPIEGEKGNETHRKQEAGETQDEYLPIEKPAEMIFQTPPEYYQEVRDAGIEGTVWVKALVLKDGSVGKAEVAKTSGTTALDQSAIEAALKNKFRPGRNNGKPVAMWVTYKVEFKLQ